MSEALARRELPVPLVPLAVMAVLEEHQHLARQYYLVLVVEAADEEGPFLRLLVVEAAEVEPQPVVELGALALAWAEIRYRRLIRRSLAFVAVRVLPEPLP